MALKRFGSYFTGRKQFVPVNGMSSDILDVNVFPKGLLLFLIFINNLPSVSKKLNFYLFADDTNIYFDAENLEKIEKKKLLIITQN